MIFSLESHGVESAKVSLLNLGRRAEFAEPAMNRIADEVILGEKALFAERGARRPKPQTVARKLRDKDPHVKANAAHGLHGTGLLARTMTTRGAVSKVDGQLLEVDRTSLRFGIRPDSRIWYGRFFGVVRFTPAQRRLAAEIIARHIVS